MRSLERRKLTGSFSPRGGARGMFSPGPALGNSAEGTELAASPSSNSAGFGWVAVAHVPSPEDSSRPCQAGARGRLRRAARILAHVCGLTLHMKR